MAKKNRPWQVDDSGSGEIVFKREDNETAQRVRQGRLSNKPELRSREGRRRGGRSPRRRCR